MARGPLDVRQGFHDVDTTGAIDAFETYLAAMHRYLAAKVG